MKSGRMSSNHIHGRRDAARVLQGRTGSADALHRSHRRRRSEGRAPGRRSRSGALIQSFASSLSSRAASAMAMVTGLPDRRRMATVPSCSSRAPTAANTGMPLSNA